MTNWIDIKGNPPPRDVPILISDGTFVTTAEAYFYGPEKRYYSFSPVEYGSHDGDWDFEPEDVTHWAECPEPPKK